MEIDLGELYSGPWPVGQGGRGSKEFTGMVDLYWMHARIGDEVIDYKAFFSWIAGLAAPDRVTKFYRDLSIGIERFPRRRNRLPAPME